MTRVTKLAIGAISVLVSGAIGGAWMFAEAEDRQFGTPKGMEGTRMFNATEHPYYSGEFHLSGASATMVGSMQDVSPWDHLDYAGKHLIPVQGSIDITVNELTNTGQVIAEFVEGADRYRIVFDRFNAKAPYQNGGIATRVYEHGDSNNGDPLYPKTWLYLAGWGSATMFKNQEVRYKDYDAHFMVMERSRDPKTHGDALSGQAHASGRGNGPRRNGDRSLGAIERTKHQELSSL